MACVLGIVLGADAAAQPPAAQQRTDPALAAIEDDPALPRVLLIGDSISIGYTLPTRQLLAGTANVHRIPENGGPTTNGLAKLRRWLGEAKSPSQNDAHRLPAPRWDVIHFNWGLHDLKLMEDGKHQVPIDPYRKNLETLVRELKATGARLIWASTTPVPAGDLNPPRRSEDVRAYNDAAKEIMDRHGISINDLYAFALPQLERIQRPANVHFTAEGSAILAQQVAARIRAALAAPPQTANRIEEVPLWVAGEGGYHTYRIPSLIVTTRGTLLAFCEGRKHGRGDSGDIDLLLRRSSDGGKTWGPVQIIADDGPNTFGNPCPVVDRNTGTVWLPITRNLGEDKEDKIRDRTSKGTRECWLMKSTDDGVTWSAPVEITASTKDSHWTWYATGPGCGIQLATGRLLIPCDHTEAGTKMNRSHVIYSDDHGASWKLGGVLGDYTNECQVVELSDGTLVINMRSYHGRNRRAVATSWDGGLSWSEVTLDPVLIEPVCQASLVRLPGAAGAGADPLVFSNPASTRREKMTVRLSPDGGKTWPIARMLHEGPAAYSALAVLPDQTIACLYERGQQSPYETLTLARFSLDWLKQGQ